MQQQPTEEIPVAPVFLTDKLFAELVAVWHQQTHIPEDLLETTRKAIYPLALPMEALNAFRDERWKECVNYCYGFYQFQSVLPNHFIGMMADAARHCGRTPYLAWPILEFAENAIALEQYDMALSAIKQIFSFSGDLQMIECPTNVLRIAHDLEVLADKFKPVEPAVRRRHRKPRIAIVSTNLVDHMTAHSKNVMHLAKHIDRERYMPYFYFTETTVAERPQDFSIRFDVKPSAELAPQRLQELKQRKVNTWYAPHLSFVDTARALAERMESDEIDAVIFQGGINATIMWLASKICAVPVRISLCLGVNMYQTGMDGSVYTNRHNKAREADFWNTEWGEQLYLDGSVDLEEIARSEKPARSEINLPDDAVVFGTLSSSIELRITTPYLDCVAEILEECPNSYFLCMGRGDSSRAQELMENRGLGDRCRWLIGQVDEIRSLRYLDIYINEFPVGGSQCLREALVCGIPALSMMCSNLHNESIGADIVGEDCTFVGNDPSPMIKQVIEWIRDPEARCKAADEAQDRARLRFSAKGFADGLMHLTDHHLQRKTKAARK